MKRFFLPLFLLVIFQFSFGAKKVLAATYTWNQTDWSAGLDNNTFPSHANNQTSWAKYYSKDSNIQIDSGSITFPSSAGSVVQTSDTDLNAGTTASTTVSSNAIVLSSSYCPSSITVNHVAGAVAPVTKTVIYGVIASTLSGSNKCWITQNLGADRQATSVTDNTEPSRGWLWRFNKTQGYKYDGSSFTPTWNSSSIDQNSDWTSDNDPCTLQLGAGWRIPTNTEWTNVDSNGGWNNYSNAYASVLKLHSAGFVNGGGSFANYEGHYWASTQNGTTYGYYLSLTSSASNSFYNGKSWGRSVRCIKDAVATYSTSGTFVSSSLDLGQNSNFTTLTFGVTTPANTTIKFQLRSADTPAGLISATWYGPTGTDDYYTAVGTTINSIHNGDRYIQYKAFLDTTNTSVTPTINDVTVNYNYYAFPVGSTTQTSDSDFNIGTTTTNISISANAIKLPTQSACGTSFVINHVAGAVAPVNKTVTYGTVASSMSGSNKCWITQNLGAGNSAGASNDSSENAAGWYWQFNRKQGYKYDTSITPVWTINSINETSDWTSNNDPCTLELGSVWRLPNNTELTNVGNTLANYDVAWLSPLKLHAGGYISSGGLSFRGSFGIFWSSTQDTNY